MKNTRFFMAGMAAILLTLGLVLAGCGDGGDDSTKKKAEANAKALQAAGEITINAPKAGVSGETIALGITVGKDEVVITIDGEEEPMKSTYSITDTSIILDNINGAKVTLGYIINEGILTITSGLDTIPGASLKGGEVKSELNENLTPPVEESKPGTVEESKPGTVEESKPGTVVDTSAPVYTEKGKPYTGDITVKIRVSIDRDTWESAYLNAGTITNGKLTLSLPSASDIDQYLSVPADKDAKPENKIIISPDSTRILGGDAVFRFLNDNGAEIGRLWYGQETETAGDEVMYWYFDQAATIKGAETGSYTDNGKKISYTDNYDISASKGWNKIYSHYTDTADSKTNTVTSNLSGLPTAAHWIIRFDDDQSGED